MVGGLFISVISQHHAVITRAVLVSGFDEDMLIKTSFSRGQKEFAFEFHLTVLHESLLLRIRFHTISFSVSDCILKC